MENKEDKNKEIATLILDSYKNKLLHIEWGKNGYSLKLEDDFDLESVEKKEFANYAFSVISIVKNILTDKKIKEKDELKINIAREIAEYEKDNAEVINLKKKSILDTYKSIEYNIITHNISESNLFKSAILKIYYENEEDTKSINIEISKKEINNLITTLNNVISEL